MRDKPLILVVDDEEFLRDIVSTKLNVSGFDAITAANAVGAVETTREKMPDLVLMDIHMPPGNSGTDAALEIRQSPELRDIRIAFLSNLKDPWPRTTPARNSVARALGVEDFIDKTGDLDLLVAKIREILSRPRK